MSDLEHLEITVGGLTFDALVAGPDDGELVLLLHGFPQTSWSWRHQLPVLGAAGYRAVAPDQRGYSPGARPAEVEAYRSLSLVGDVLALADALGAARFHLVGHDWGAAVAWQVAGRHPERLRTLTILSVPHPLAFGRALAGEGGADQAGRSAYIDFFRSADAAAFLVADGAAGLKQLFLATGLPEDQVVEYVRALGTQEAMQAALNWYRAADLTLVEGLGPITTPTMFCWSTDDPALGREAAEWTAEHVDGPYRFEVFEGVGHWIAEQAPELLDRLLLDHLGTSGAAGG
ncbi:MAG: alpha/beta hydrolase [Acidimicrobiales bacterium]|nr:alpha/beta hydrolase [Acidimicrobiales bacterium]